MRSKLVLGIADGWLSADGTVIYRHRPEGRPVPAGCADGGRRLSRAPCELRRTGQVCPMQGMPDRGRGPANLERRCELTADRTRQCMRRVVVTGMGIVSSIGNNTQEVLASLREAKSGISRADEYAELGFRCQVHGAPTLDPSEIGRPPRHALPRPRRGLEPRRDGAGDPRRGLEENDISNERTGIIMGSGGPRPAPSSRPPTSPAKRVPKRVGPFAVPKAMSSTASATLATWFKIKGVNYSISSACATSNHCIGNAAETIQWGKQDMVFAGGCEDLDWTLSVLFDAMGAMSSRYNETPRQGLARL